MVFFDAHPVCNYGWKIFHWQLPSVFVGNGVYKARWLYISTLCNSATNFCQYTQHRTQFDKILIRDCLLLLWKGSRTNLVVNCSIFWCRKDTSFPPATHHWFYCGILGIVLPDLKKQTHQIKHCCLHYIVDTLAVSGSSGTRRLWIIITIGLIKNVKKSTEHMRGISNFHCSNNYHASRMVSIGYVWR